ncbi:hypothetical protein [uncultured Planktosalinus sp.]|uniref:hypothetical protein n=1 Tax=uncultured Planktosalinus sp. TaxID=1810935 RepID=UPI0030D728B4
MGGFIYDCVLTDGVASPPSVDRNDVYYLRNPGLFAQKWAIYGVELPKRERERVLF